MMLGISGVYALGVLLSYLLFKYHKRSHERRGRSWRSKDRGRTLIASLILSWVLILGLLITIVIELIEHIWNDDRPVKW